MWMRGQQSLRAEDNRTYFTEVSADELKRQYDVKVSLLLHLAQSVVDGVAENADKIDQTSRHLIADRIDALNRELDHQQEESE